MQELECSQILLLWQVLMAREHPEGLKVLGVINLSQEMGLSVLSAISKSTIKSLTNFHMIGNEDWLEKDTPFEQLRTILS